MDPNRYGYGRERSSKVGVARGRERPIERSADVVDAMTVIRKPVLGSTILPFGFRPTEDRPVVAGVSAKRPFHVDC